MTIDKRKAKHPDLGKDVLEEDRFSEESLIILARDKKPLQKYREPPYAFNRKGILYEPSGEILFKKGKDREEYIPKEQAAKLGEELPGPPTSTQTPVRLISDKKQKRSRLRIGSEVTEIP